MIDLKNISVIYHSKDREVKAIQDVSLCIGQGEIFGIVGASGAGKSTLVRTINLLEKPTAGTVSIDGVDITGFKGEALRKVRVRIGMIFQHFNLIRGKNVFENIAFALKASGKTDKEEIRQRTLELLDLVGLSDKENAYPSQLSGGQKQRVGIARALANHPQILLCDEPTSALDLETTESILHLLKDINEKLGITIVIITHEMDVVKRICDRVAVMKDGKLLEVGNVYDIFAHPVNDFTKQLIQHTLKLEIPQQIFQEHKGTLLKILYKGHSATDPILSDAAKQYAVDINILHGKIEYIGEQPVGILVVHLTGKQEEVENVLEYIRKKTSDMEVLYAS